MVSINMTILVTMEFGVIRSRRMIRRSSLQGRARADGAGGAGRKGGVAEGRRSASVRLTWSAGNPRPQPEPAGGGGDASSRARSAARSSSGTTSQLPRARRSVPPWITAWAHTRGSSFATRSSAER